ncbi:MAG TPA: hypothetical protein PK281_03635 [Flavobacteriales bacterium]|jgi:hypothetical protein|nr:hypothetical protein [Flavobacteriales bacterium]
MKRSYLFTSLLAGLFMILSGMEVSAQSVSNSGSALLNKNSLKQDSANTFISFSPVYLDGKTYVRWLVKNDKKDGVFVVERSENGTDFEALGFRDRVGTQLLVNLFYSFVDEEPIPGDSHYRIMQVGADNTYRYSSVVKVHTPIEPRQVGSSANADAPVPTK